MESLLQALRNLGPARLAIMGGVGLGLIIFFVFLTTRLAGPQMALLYGNLTADDSAAIITQLESTNTPFEMRNNGTEIYVPDTAARSLRVTMAKQGLPGGGTIGYEIFDKSDSLGTTNFVQNINLIRALEGELSRTIRSISNVASARVHLVLPRREVFSRKKQEPSASIILNMQGAHRLDTEQVAAVRQLVAAAVPGLIPRRVSVIDNKGTLLARGFDGEAGTDAVAVKAEQRQRNFENRLARTIEELLEKTVGFGRVRAEVSAQMDFDRISTSEERFDPDGQVVRSTQSVEQTSSNREGDAGGLVSVGTNLPDPNVGGGENSTTSADESRTEETVNFEVSKKVINHVREVGNIKRLSVAVLLDGTLSPADKNGERKYEPRTEQEMELLATLVRSAIGFNSDRGDTVEVINMQFADPPEEEIQLDLDLFFGLDKSDLLRMAEILVLSIVAILVILLVVRPLVSRALEAVPVITANMAESRLLADQSAQQAALAGPAAPSDMAPTEEFEELIDIDRVEGRVKASSAKKVGEIVEKHPEEALSIIRTWMFQQG